MFEVWEAGRSGATEYSDSGPSRTLLFKGKETYDSDEAEFGFLAYAPVLISNVGFRKSYRITPAGGGCWDAEFQYAPGKRQQSGDPARWSFETGGGSTHIEHSLETVGAYVPEGDEVTDFQRLIGVTRDAVEGCDVTIPALNLRAQIVLPYNAVTEAWIVQTAYLTGTTNGAPWKGFAIGEVLFLGCSGGMRGSPGDAAAADWDLSFAFAAGPNLTNLTIGQIEGINKKAWEYLWQRKVQYEAGAGGFMISKPVQVNVERVYQYGSFAALPV